ncbi:MAG: thioredoxin domain-containing protein [Armatimonadota bacterium]|nr:thioredoxin domain-containing protein [Armatimonadota bacterium]
MPNRLVQETSPYLRAAADQPVDWYPWGEEAFEKARREGRPILLDIGASWCHWCHVMDRESYEDPEVARIINENFVPVKVDRDERPDVDARYQMFVGALTGEGGWPLTAFLTPEGKVFFGGTYFPPEDAYGRPGFKRVLLSVASYYRDHRDQVLEYAEDLFRQLHEGVAGVSPPRELSPSLVQRALEDIGRSFDTVHGGFGGAPKFPHPSAIELVLRRFYLSGEEWLGTIATRTLEKMAKGGIHDHLGGGFHRYATDAKWTVPHFEKLLSDNALLLSNYVQAFQVTGSKLFQHVALGILGYLASELYDRERGGFFASQDADVGDEEGGYYLWTEEEVRSLLDPGEFAVVSSYFHLSGRGEIPHDPDKHVLYCHKEADVVAALLSRPQEEVVSLLASAKEKLKKARALRPRPFVDSTVYASWNGMAISACLEAYAALGVEGAREMALRTLERFLNQGRRSDGAFLHALTPEGPRPEWFLEDQVFMGKALFDAFAITGEAKYLRTAAETAEVILREFRDRDGTLVDTPLSAGGGLGFLYRPIQDSPIPGCNAAAARFFLSLGQVLDEPRYRQAAEKILSSFGGLAERLGLHASTYFLALDEFCSGLLHVVIVGDGERARALHEVALKTFYPGKVVTPLVDLLAREEFQVPVPKVLKSMMEAAHGPRAYLCRGVSCAPPVDTPGAFQEVIQMFRG